MEDIDEPLLADAADELLRRQNDGRASIGLHVAVDVDANDEDALELRNPAFLLDTSPNAMLADVRRERASRGGASHPTSSNIFDDL